MAKYKNLLFIILLGALFVEVLIIFPSRLEHEDEKAVRTRVEAQQKIAEEKEKREKETGEKEKTPSAMAGQKMQGVHLVESQKGNRDWELFAVSAEGSQTAGTWRLNDVRVLFYNNEKVEFTVTGDSGTIDSKTRDLNIVGNVTTKSENGYNFQTPSIFYSSLTRLIESPEQVVMLGPSDASGGGMALRGRKMKVNVEQSKMLIQDKVQANKTMKNGKTFDVSASGAEFNGKNHEAKFLGTVQITYDNMKLEGPEAAFLYQAGANVLSTVNINGGVKVSDVDKFATSQSVNLDLLKNQYTFKGRPRVIQNSDELTGEEIVFLDGGKKVKVERVRAKVDNKTQ